MKAIDYLHEVEDKFKDFRNIVYSPLTDMEGKTVNDRLRNYRNRVRAKTLNLINTLKLYESFIEEFSIEEKSQKKVEIGTVWRSKIFDSSFVVSLKDKQIIERDPENYEFVCEKPHEDGDYSYLCFSQYCKCQQ